MFKYFPYIEQSHPLQPPIYFFNCTRVLNPSMSFFREINNIKKILTNGSIRASPPTKNLIKNKMIIYYKITPINHVKNLAEPYGK